MSDTNTPPPSSKGKVVIPESLTPSVRDEFFQLVRDARRAARRSGLKPSDVTQAIAKVRRMT